MKTIFLTLFSLLAINVFSQITISQSDFENAWQAGHKWNIYGTPSGSPVNVFVGSASSSSQTWDFSTYAVNLAGYSFGVEPSSAPFISDFAASNAVLLNKAWLGVDTFNTWQYQHIDNNFLSLMGTSSETAVELTYDPPFKQAAIPLTYGSTWESARDCTVTMPPYYVLTIQTAIVDAYGTIQLPQGSFPCLRLTRTRTSYNHTPMGVDTTHIRSYHFYTEDLLDLNITNVLEAQFGQENIDVSGFNYSVPQGIGAVNEWYAGRSAILSNHPNPFTDNTAVSYTINQGGVVNLKVFDILGNEVATLVNGYRTAGSHETIFDSSGLEPGLYFCRMTSSDNHSKQAHRMILTR